MKELFQDCWATSDSCKAFAQALAARGFYLAKGDRRGFVALDVHGEVYAITRWTGLKAKGIEARLGDPANLPSVTETKVHIAELLKGTLGRHLAEVEAEHQIRMLLLTNKRIEMRREQRKQRDTFTLVQSSRAVDEARQRAQRFRRSLRGIWDRLVGQHARIRRKNEADALATLARDRAEKLTLIQTQLLSRRILQHELQQVHNGYNAEVATIHGDLQLLSSGVSDASQELPIDPAVSEHNRRQRRQEPSP